MTTQTEAGAAKSFVSASLPWIVAVLAAVVYLLTLNPWASPQNLHEVARATGQTWFSEIALPVFQLTTSPFRWLPETWVPAALNVFSAVCAAIVLGLLARCVALLPQDRTYKQREREQSPFGLLSAPMAWIPPLLAVIVCGLQLTFWENATNSSNNIFDLALFAYSVRCLLEYRVSDRESWLLRAALVYTAGMTDTWVLLALLPAFLATLVWIKGLGFFQLQFLARLFLCVLVGLLFYLYLPLIHLRTDGFFWQTLRENFRLQFQTVETVYRYVPHPFQFLLTLTSLLPLLVIGIRWKSHFGDSSQFGTALTTWIFHLTHAVLLGVCIWSSFDTGFSLRSGQGKFQFLDFHRDEVLPLYYLGALSIGYLSGYFLLVFKPLPQRSYRTSGAGATVLDNLSVGIVCLLTVLTPLGLVYKNLPEIKTRNGPSWQQYASALTENLPSHAVLLSDRWDTLAIAQVWLARNGKASNYVFLETHSLKIPAYHRFQRAKHPEVWPVLTKAMYRDDFQFTDPALVDLLVRLAGRRPLYYLNPSFGGYFETFYLVPHGLVYEMKQYATNTAVSPPPLSEAVFAENENFWKTHESSFQKLLPYINPPGPTIKPTFRSSWMQRMHIPFEKNPTARELGYFYSLALNTLGVQEQRLGRLDAAAKHFADAQEFSPDNIVAGANLEFNKKLRTGERIVADSPETFEQHFGKFDNWEQILNANGPFDTATGCLAQGIVFARGRLVRQAADEFERVLSLVPNNLLGRLWLARTYVLWMPEKTLPLIQDLKAHSDSWADEAITPSDILRIELAADYANKMTDKIPATLENLSDVTLFDAAAQTCVGFGDYTNTLLVVQKRLVMNPDNLPSLMTEGFAQMRLKRFDQAIAPLTHVISLQPTNSFARLYRAISYLQITNFDESQHDYETLEKTQPAACYYGLGEIAFAKKDTNAAIHYYQLALAKMDPNSQQARFLANRVKGLQAASP